MKPELGQGFDPARGIALNGPGFKEAKINGLSLRSL